eukprot:CAMPEP_0113941682 /NCGR_PEP_ID=MMETSP1339-20121228/7550_1 /TAXON_ID=94617 /ORGANISM="Fibrocapsa japonica" /LENGTH=171 /DNA_ID=CAMNT_0000945897 /DNA_START=304 /DNA_END=819 /DNA_ORIENTATION=+ /assembly_acc=CAM_ASM_000762
MLVKVVASCYEAAPQLVLQTIMIIVTGAPSVGLYIASITFSIIVSLIFLGTIRFDFHEWKNLLDIDEEMPSSGRADASLAANDAEANRAGGMAEAEEGKAERRGSFAADIPTRRSSLASDAGDEENPVVAVRRKSLTRGTFGHQKGVKSEMQLDMGKALSELNKHSKPDPM